MTGRIRRIGAWIAHSTETLLSAKTRKTVARSIGGVGLFPAIITALGLGVVLAVAAQWILRRFIATSAAVAAPIDVTKLSLTVVAGVGGTVALVVAYRRQRDLEQGRFVERFGAAAAQLGATDVAVRIAGVYAMAGVADESTGRRRQQCIDVLCGYLRLPYDADHGASGRAKFVVKAPRVDHGRVRGETEEHIEYRQNDREVRQTIVRVIADHLRPTAEYSWSKNDFDFRTAYLEDADFSHATFAGPARFGNARFSGVASFDDTTFSHIASFERATFCDIAWFERAIFSDFAWFEDVMFCGLAQFGSVTFTIYTWFEGATFGSNAWFERATFSSNTTFERATFSGSARFGDVTFSGPTRFKDAKFSDTATFGGATFTGEATFEMADFGAKTISFAEPKQWGPPGPLFDWNEDVAQKPTNVEPHHWPPTTATYV
ncbi:pentapeptide repeat-containing protein [Nocardia vinacea]|uniref:pentapeptide repeat-containing protein n=1 Tax=Nocardia vinacea TaxID=96468 RepID=UPI0009FF91E0|nr:pentapeptide repeat-containing protein [Nocardia vinacea]